MRYTNSLLIHWGVRDIRDREDILQSAYLEAFRSWHTIADVTKRRAWFRTIVRRQYAIYVSGGVKLRELMDTFNEDAKVIDPEQTYSGRERCLRIVQRISDVRDKMKRKALSQFFIEMKPLKEISQELGVKLSTLTTWCHRFRTDMVSETQDIRPDTNHKTEDVQASNRRHSHGY
ncbi:MAG: hypothetical protein HRU19_01455 [Pseudobacteriovorax sp.]|nr:hypothetical protein [Pseudobacteriovorax sp.]